MSDPILSSFSSRKASSPPVPPKSPRGSNGKASSPKPTLSMPPSPPVLPKSPREAPDQSPSPSNFRASIGLGSLSLSTLFLDPSPDCVDESTSPRKFPDEAPDSRLENAQTMSVDSLAGKFGLPVSRLTTYYDTDEDSPSYGQETYTEFKSDSVSFELPKFNAGHGGQGSIWNVSSDSVLKLRTCPGDYPSLEFMVQQQRTLVEELQSREPSEHLMHVESLFLCEGSRGLSLAYLLERCDGDILKVSDRFNGKPNEVLRLVDHIFQGAEELWRVGYTHLDIKPQNVLFKMNTSGIHTYKLCDFDESAPITDPTQKGLDIKRIIGTALIMYTKDESTTTPKAYEMMPPEDLSKAILTKTPGDSALQKRLLALLNYLLYVPESKT